MPNNTKAEAEAAATAASTRDPTIRPDTSPRGALDREGEARWPSGVATLPQEPPDPELAPETPPAPAEGRPTQEPVDIEAMPDDDLAALARQSLRGLTDAQRALIYAAGTEAKRRDPEFKVRERRRRRRKRWTSRGDEPEQER